MKRIFFSLLAISAIVFAACNSGGSKNEHEGHDTNKDTTMHTTVTCCKHNGADG